MLLRGSYCCYEAAIVTRQLLLLRGSYCCYEAAIVTGQLLLLLASGGKFLATPLNVFAEQNVLTWEWQGEETGENCESLNSKFIAI